MKGGVSRMYLPSNEYVHEAVSVDQQTSFHYVRSPWQLMTRNIPHVQIASHPNCVLLKNASAERWSANLPHFIFSLPHPSSFLLSFSPCPILCLLILSIFSRLILFLLSHAVSLLHTVSIFHVHSHTLMQIVCRLPEEVHVGQVIDIYCMEMPLKCI